MRRPGEPPCDEQDEADEHIHPKAGDLALKPGTLPRGVQPARERAAALTLRRDCEPQNLGVRLFIRAGEQRPEHLQGMVVPSSEQAAQPVPDLFAIGL